ILQEIRIDIRRVDEKIRPQEPREGSRSQLIDIGRQLIFGVAPGEVSIGLGKSQLRQMIHNLWARKRLGQENRIGVESPHIRQQPLPEREWLCMRVVDTK